MILFDRLEQRLDELGAAFRQAQPFPHVIVDGFADAERLAAAVAAIPDPALAGIRKSRDYVFARNKFEKSNFRELSPEFAELYGELGGERFRAILRRISGEDVFVDPEYFGGGIHQGGAGSFLDLHADFNFHPLHADWFRNLNILLYLNAGWQREHAGELRLRHRDTGAEHRVEPLFNRCVVMLTRAHTLHGYDPIRFPAGSYRRSLAAYGYSLATDRSGRPRSTTWYPDHGGIVKRWVGRAWPTLVKLKNLLFGSATAKNR
jgi:hypothetical protein